MLQYKTKVAQSFAGTPIQTGTLQGYDKCHKKRSLTALCFIIVIWQQVIDSDFSLPTLENIDSLKKEISPMYLQVYKWIQ